MNDCPSNIILINGPTGSGKSLYIRQLGASPANTLTSEQLVDQLLQMCHSKTSIEDLVRKLQHIYYVQNMESLAGKEETQELAAQLIQSLAKNHPITLTGINFPQNTPFFLSALEEYHLLQLPKR